MVVTTVVAATLVLLFFGTELVADPAANNMHTLNSKREHIFMLQVVIVEFRVSLLDVFDVKPSEKFLFSSFQTLFVHILVALIR